MSFSDHMPNNLDDSSISGRESLELRHSFSHPTPPNNQQQQDQHDLNNTSHSNNVFHHRKCFNPIKRFFRSDDPSTFDPTSPNNNFRILPLLIGCVIPVSILINVPSITSPWVGLASYNETLHDWNDPIVLKIPNWLNTIIILALVMAILCNICVLCRFLEQYVYHSVILSLVTATIQDILCIVAVVSFGVLYPPSKNYEYLEGFWSMIASILFSFFATILISIDLHMTPHFRLQGSGVTHKQRILIADAMSLCFYLAIGALAFIYLERWTFLDALFFVMVTITTIGFGDRTPQTTGGRIFVIIYGACGIVLLALAVNAIRYVILEDLHRRFSIKAKERKLKRDARRRERRNQHIHQEEQQSQIQQAIERLQTLTRSKSVPASGASMPLEASSVSRDTLNESHYLTLFPRYFNISNDHHLRLPSLFTHTKSHPDPDLINGSSNQQNGVSNTDLTPEDDSSQNANDMLETSSINNSLGGQAEHDAAGVGSDTHVDDTQENRQAVDDDLLRYATVYPDESYQSNRIKSWLNRFFCCRQPPLPVIVHHPTLEEQREADKRQAYKESMDEYKRRLRFSASIFMIFWLVGAIIFTFVESWGFGSSVYFVFIAFSTIGYGDLVPRTIAGRAIFLGYCLVGVVTLTSLASMIAEVLSKSMRKHVVKAHLRRAVLLEALEDSNGSPESHAHEASTTEVISADGLQATETTPEDKTCCGVLQNLINVSKSLDGVLQTILGLESTVLPDPSLQFMPANPNPGAIISYLEENEDDSEPSYLSPSISRDINSTSTIHQHSLRPLMHARQHSNELQHRGTFPSTSPARQKNPSQLKITAWPTVGSPSASQHHWRHNCSHSQPSTPPPELYQKSSASHNNDDHIVTIPGAQWKILVEYSKRFKTLTLACEEALKKVTEWETSEKRLRQKRNEARQKLKTWIAEYRKKLEQLKDSHVSPEDDLEEEEELEELDEWDEEGSNDDDDDRDLDNQRAQIAATLLGPLSENPANLPLPNLSRRLSTPPTRWSSRRHNSPRSEQHQRRSSLVQEHHDRFRLRQHKMNRDQRLHHHDQDLEQGNAEQSSETVAKGVDSD